MEFFDVINKRYSYRGTFKNEPIPYEHIRLILKAGIKSPTGMNITTNNYIAITDKDILLDLSKWIPGAGASTAPFIIVIVSENLAKSYGVNFEIENYSVSTENMLLAITALGYATVWSDRILKSPQVNDGIRETLNIPKEKTIRAVLSIGVPVLAGKPQEEESIENVVIFQKYK